MNAKQFLYSIRDEQKEIEELKLRIGELRTSLLPGAIRYDKERVQTSPSDPMPDRITNIAEYEKLLRDKTIFLTGKRLQAQQMIDSLEDSRQRQVLDLYFLSEGRPRMCDVAQKIGYSQEQTYRIYKKAIMTVNDSWNL